MNTLAQEPQLILPIGHNREISEIQFSADGKKLYTSDWESLKIWDCNSGSLMEDIKNYPFYTFSSDKKKIFIKYDSHTIKIIASESGRPIIDLPLEEKLDRIDLASFSQNGNRVIIQAYGIIRVWDTQSGIPLLKINDSNSSVATFKFSPDEKYLFLFSNENENDNKLNGVWELKSGTRIFEIKREYTDYITAAQFSPDNKQIAFATENGLIKKGKFQIWDFLQKKIIREVNDKSTISYIKFGPQGKTMLTYGIDSNKVARAKILNNETGIPICELSDTINYPVNGQVFKINSLHFNPIDSALFSKDGKKIITFVDDFQNLKLWNAITGDRIINKSGSNDMNDFDMPEHKTINTKIREFGDINSWMNSGNFEIWDIPTATIEDSIVGKSDGVKKTCMSPDNEKFAALYEDNTIKLWDIKSKIVLSSFKRHTAKIHLEEIRPDNKKVILKVAKETKVLDVNNARFLLINSRCADNTQLLSFDTDNKKIIIAAGSNLKLLDAETNDIVRNFSGHTGYINSIQLSRDGKRLLSASADSTIRVWDTKNGQILLNKKVPMKVDSAKYIADEKLIFVETILPTYEFEPRVIYRGVIDAFNGNPLDLDSMTNELKDKHDIEWEHLLNTTTQKIKGPITFTVFSHNHEKILIEGSSENPVVTDSRNFLPVSLKFTSTYPTNAVFSSDDQRVITQNCDGTVSIWDVATGDLIREFKDSLNPISNFYVSHDNKKLIAESENSSLKIWDINNPTLTYEFFPIDSNDYFSQIPSGYYQCTRNAAKLLHYITKAGEVVTFEQLDIKYNRPDKVLEFIGCLDSVLIKTYRKAYEKRIEKLGIDTTFFTKGFSVPNADFINRKEIKFKQESRNLTLRIQGSDKTFNLDHFNVWVNNVPIYGMRGVSLKNEPQKSLDTAVTVWLSIGLNKIETSITDVNGTESYHLPLYVNFTPLN